jgi:CBS domain-containing protein
MKIQVKDMMTRDCKACDPSESLASAAIRMWEADCGILPVIENGRVVGVITDRDICMALALTGRRATERSIAEVASRTVVTCAPEDDVADALATMQHHQVHRLVVADQGRFAGMLSMNDVVNCGGENERLRQPILAAFEGICAHRTLPSVV